MTVKKQAVVREEVGVDKRMFQYSTDSLLHIIKPFAPCIAGGVEGVFLGRRMMRR